MLFTLFLVIAPIYSVHATELGVYEGAGCDGAKRVEDFARWAERLPDRVIDFAASDSPQSLISGLSWAANCWRSHGHPPLTMTLPLTTKGIALSSVAAGALDDEFKRAGESLVKNDYGDAIIRLGHEMNGGWYPWGNLADRDPGKRLRNEEDFKSAFIRAVRILRSVPGSHFLIDWCPAGGEQQVAPALVYPGDQFVDIIGSDVYATAWGINHPTAAQILPTLNKGWGLDTVAAFSLKHGKPMSFPEMGVGDRPSGASDYGPGDSPDVMSYLVQWVKQHSVPQGRRAGPGEIAYIGYWDYDAPDYKSKLSTGERPNEALIFKKFIQLPGPRRTSEAAVVAGMRRHWKARHRIDVWRRQPARSLDRLSAGEINRFQFLAAVAGPFRHGRLDHATIRGKSIPIRSVIMRSVRITCRTMTLLLRSLALWQAASLVLPAQYAGLDPVDAYPR